MPKYHPNNGITFITSQDILHLQETDYWISDHFLGKNTQDFLDLKLEKPILNDAKSSSWLQLNSDSSNVGDNQCSN